MRRATLAAARSLFPSPSRLPAPPPFAVARAAYHENVVDHYNNPRNVGSFDKNDPNVGTGLVGAPACGDVMKLQIKVDPETGKIVDSCFKTFGCGSAIASSSVGMDSHRCPSFRFVGILLAPFILLAFWPFSISPISAAPLRRLKWTIDSPPLIPVKSNRRAWIAPKLTILEHFLLQIFSVV
jgi:hypothetical protein